MLMPTSFGPNILIAGGMAELRSKKRRTAFTLLALYLAKDLLPEVRMKDKTRAQIASLTQTRDTMVKLRTALKNKINNICSAHGINLSKESLASEKGLKAVLEMPFDPLVDLELKILVEQIR